MKCPSCGAEIGKSKKCEFCGSQISLEMQKEQEQLNKQGCPKCGSTNIKFNREKHVEVRGKKSKRVVYRTVGVCQDCGHTWSTSNDLDIKKAIKIVLWIYGWILIFPLPLTIILLRKKNMNPKLKYGILGAAWFVYLVIVAAGMSGSSKRKKDQETKAIEQTASDNSDVTGTTETNDCNIKELKFSNDEITIETGVTDSSSWMNAVVKDKGAFSVDDVVFLSDNPSIASITLSHESLPTYLYYSVEGVSPGETYVYATSKDGSVESEHVKVTVTESTEAAATASVDTTEVTRQVVVTPGVREVERSEESSAQNESATGATTEEIIPINTEANSVAESDQDTSRSVPVVDAEPASNQSSGNADNFNLYDNEEQQNTAAAYVLNLGTGKFHYPWCKDVPKIKEENYYEVWDESRDDLISRGYSPCGHCNP